MDWFRLYSDVIDHEKLMLLSPEAFRFWIMLLCVASKMEVRGTLPDMDAIVFRTRSEHSSAHVLIDVLMRAELIERAEDGSLRVHDWDQHQRKSDDAAARMRQIRGKTKPKTAKTKGNSGCGISGVPNTFRTSSENVRARAEQNRAEQTPLTPQGENGQPAACRFDDERLEEAHQRCITLATTLFGADKAKTVSAKGMEINDGLLGRFDCYEAALREVDRRLKQPGAKPVRNFHTLALTIAQEYRVNGIPAESNELKPVKPPEPVFEWDRIHRAPRHGN